MKKEIKKSFWVKIMAFFLVLLGTAFLGKNTKTLADSTLDPTDPISVSGGKISGTYSKDQSIAEYKGIPYAKPPVGNLRWQAPQDVSSWQGVKKTTQFGKNPMQAKMYMKAYPLVSREFQANPKYGMSENCLSLNVWANKNKAQKKPVIVYIYGGGFDHGGTSAPAYDGENLAKKGAVVVSMNYRTGILGFLAHPKLTKEAKDHTSGNYGLLDQIKALQWVKANIGQFGGNAKNVTIMGQSAGAWSVNDLIASPKARGLFSKAISLSANYYSLKSPTLKSQEKKGQKAFVGKSLKQMRKISAKKLLKMKYNQAPNSVPNIDRKVLLGNYLDQVKKKKAADITLMSGYTGDESVGEMVTEMSGNGLAGDINVSKKSYIKQVKGKTGRYAKAFLKMYPASNKNNKKIAEKLNADDLLFKQNHLAQIRNRNYRSKTYNYLFSHITPGPHAKKFGAFHASDQPYFFDNFIGWRKNYWQGGDFNLGNTMSKYLVNFAKFGNPNSNSLPQWNANNGTDKYMNLNSISKQNQLSKNKVQLFQKLYNFH